MVAQIEGGTQAEVVYEQGAEGIFGLKKDEVTGEWRKLHKEELTALYSLPNIIRGIKSRRIRWAGHVARMGEGRDVPRVLVEKPDGKRPLGRPRHRGEDNMKRIFSKWVGGAWTGLVWFRIGTGGGLLEME